MANMTKAQPSPSPVTPSPIQELGFLARRPAPQNATMAMAPSYPDGEPSPPSEPPVPSGPRKKEPISFIPYSSPTYIFEKSSRSLNQLDPVKPFEYTPLQSWFGTLAFGPLGPSVFSHNGHNVNFNTDVFYASQGTQSMLVPLNEMPYHFGNSLTSHSLGETPMVSTEPVVNPETFFQMFGRTALEAKRTVEYLMGEKAFVDFTNFMKSRPVQPSPPVINYRFT
jgi:hypothetical protein